MRVVIVGCGVIGSLTAVDCASAGHDVVLFEQVGIPSRAAASFDRHRVLRALHLASQSATVAAVRAHYQWMDLQRVLSARFYERVGALTVLPPEELPRAWAMLTRAGSRARVLDAAELAASYPQVRFPAGASAVFESQAGVLLADRVLAACAAWLRLYTRAELHPCRTAVGVDVDGTAVRLADGEVVRADALLLATGRWSRELLGTDHGPGLGIDLGSELVLHRQSMIYCEVPAANAAAWSVTPAIASLGTAHGAWLVPPVADTPLKLSAASACRVVAQPGDSSTPPYWRDHLVDVFAALIPGFDAGWVFGARDCYYLARAATGGPMLAALSRRVLSYAACGGSSFKFAPLIARWLAERLTGADVAPTGLGPLDHGILELPSRSGTVPRQADPVMRGVS